MEGAWLTYREAAERLGSTAEAVRYRAIRGKWPRRRGNDGRARVQIPEEPNPVRTPSAPRAHGGSDQALVHALEAHVETLKAEIETLKAHLAAADTRDAQHVADSAAEREKTEKAIAAFAALAERLDALAAERSRPWWRRLVG
jgi:hypothetical protein